MTVMNSLERMLRILDLFTEERLAWTSEQMISELGYSRPTLYRYLKSLRDKGLLTSDSAGNYTLGPKVVEMDYVLRRSDCVAIQSRPILDALVAKHSGTAFVARWYRTQILCVECASSLPLPRSSYPRGRPMPIGRGAASRAILAFLPSRQAERVIQEQMPEFRAVGFGDTVDEVKKGLARIRRAGIAFAQAEVTPKVAGFSAPLFDGSAAPIGSLSLMLPEELATRKVQEHATADVRAAAAELNANLLIASARSS